MIAASTLVALPLLLIALVARRFRSDLEEAAWRLMAVTMLAAPLLSFVPKFDIGMEIPFVTGAPFFSLNQPELPTDSDISFFTVVYAIVALFFLTRLAIAAASAWKLRHDAKPFGAAFVSPSLRLPVTAGLFAPAIFLPTDAPAWTAGKLAAVLAHERAHVARRDPLWRFVGRAAAAVCWFHPLAWLAARSIERIAEERADQEAVAVTGNRHEYASVILDFLRAMTSNPSRILAIGILDGRAIAARIDAILQPPRTRRSRRGTRIVLAALVASAIVITGMTTNEGAPPETGHRAVRSEQQQRADEEFFRKRDEIRNFARERIRNTTRALFRGLFRGVSH